jgi:hypothetical protein
MLWHPHWLSELQLTGLCRIPMAGSHVSTVPALGMKAVLAPLTRNPSRGAPPWPCFQKRSGHVTGAIQSEATKPGGFPRSLAQTRVSCRITTFVSNRKTLKWHKYRLTAGPGPPAYIQALLSSTSTGVCTHWPLLHVSVVHLLLSAS